MDVWKAYRVQRGNARRRGIVWGFTFASWLEFWGESLPLRGRGRDGLVMCRYGDAGPYCPDNCYISTSYENLNEPQVRRKRAENATGVVRAHLRDRERHPRARIVVDPFGVEWPSAALAGEHWGYTRQRISQMAREGREWRYL